MRTATLLTGLTLVACNGSTASTEGTSSGVKAQKLPKNFGCKDLEAQPELDVASLTQEALSTTVPFTIGHPKANVYAAYAQFFEGFEKQPSPPPPVSKKTPQGYKVERLGGRLMESECRKSRESFHFKTLGIRYFFNHQDLVKTIRIDAPFAGTYRGVKLGMSRDELVAKLGEPFRIFEWSDDHAHVFEMPNGNNLRVDIEPESQTAVRMFD